MNDRRTVLYLLIIALACLIVGIGMSGCASSDATEGTDADTVLHVNTGAYNSTVQAWVYVVTDRDTGVQYIVTRGYNNDVSICPRYGSDGEIADTGAVE